MGTAKRGFEKSEFDYDRRLLTGLHHMDWRESGMSKDPTKYKSVILKEKENRPIHKGLL